MYMIKKLTCKPWQHLCTLIMSPLREKLGENIPFTIAPRKNQILKNLSKKVKDLYNTNYNTLEKKKKADIRK